MKNTEK